MMLTIIISIDEEVKQYLESASICSVSRFGVGTPGGIQG